MKRVVLANGMSTLHSFSPDGKKLMVHLTSTGVNVFDLSSKNSNENDESKSTILEDTGKVAFMSFSSKGSYIITWERAQKPAEGETESPPNLKIWSSTTGRFLYGFVMKLCKKSQWPPVRWSHDEKKAFHLVTSEIRVYDGHAFGEEEVKYNDRIRCKGVSAFSLPPNSVSLEEKYIISTFVPETKGKPARVSLLLYPDKLGTTENPKSGDLLVSKSFYQAEECSVNWSPKGDAALALTTTSVDTSGDSYYGSSNLFLLLSESRSSIVGGEALAVPLPGGNGKASVGPIHDVSWMPNGTKPPVFCVVSGKMPSMTSLHDGYTAEPTFLFGNAHRNTIVWSDHGRFVTLGGFGNLAGGMDFYDRNKLKKIPQFDPNGANLGANGNTAQCAVGYGWSPSSRFFMVSTTTPRMNVDNGVRLYKYNGLEICDKSIISWDNEDFKPNQLLAAEFVPASTGAYPDRPQTPPPRRPDGESAPAPAAAARAPASAAYVPPVGRYVPPSARKSGMSLADRMRKEREGSTVGATKVIPKGLVGAANGKRLPVGMAPADDKKSKSAIKRERAKLAKQKAELAEKEEKERQEREEKERLEATRNDPVKRTKKLKKILKQIDSLKEKDASTLNDDQKAKLAMEEEVLKELAELNV